MKNEYRSKRIKAITEQMQFCMKCMQTLMKNFEENNKAQDDDPWDNYNAIRNHYQHSNDVIYIRRQLMTLEKMLRG